MASDAKNRRLKTGLVGIAVLGLLFFGQITVVSAAAAPASQNPGVSKAGQDVLDFLGATAEKSGLTNNASADTTDVYDIIAAIINTVLGLTGIIFFVQVFWAGFRWMTAGGAEETITTAKKTIVSSVIGIAIALSAFVITNFVLNKIEDVNRGTIEVSPPSASPGTPSPVEDGAVTTGTQDAVGSCEILTLEGATSDQDIWSECLSKTSAECRQEAGDARFRWTASPCPQ